MLVSTGGRRQPCWYLLPPGAAAIAGHCHCVEYVSLFRRYHIMWRVMRRAPSRQYLRVAGGERVLTSQR